MIFDCISAFCKKFLGIEIERRTDFIAFTALLLSLLTAATATSSFLYGRMVGARVQMGQHSRVAITGAALNTEEKYAHVIATLFFTNHGQIGYDAVIERITATLAFSADGSTYRQEWDRFATFINDAGALVEYTSQGTAVPLQVPGRSALSRDIYFAPFEVRCLPGQEKCQERQNFLEWKTLKEKMVDGQFITLTFTAQRAMEDSPVTSPPCRIRITGGLIEAMEEHGWFADPCWPKEE